MAKKAGKDDGSSAGCPCGSAREFAACCGKYLDQGAVPETAEQLMRSRYTAYALERADYLTETWHRSTRPPSLEIDPRLQWLGLKILQTTQGGAGDTEGWVEFLARVKLGGRAERMQECSRFVRENGRWYYIDGRVD